MSRPTLQRATIAPDYPNFGEYQGDVYAMGYASASMKAIWNNIRAVDVLTERPDVDAGRIGVIGHSLGGHNAIFTALFEPRIKAIVSSCGFNAFPDYFRGDIAGWSHSGYMPRLRTRYGLDLHKVPFDFPELIGALAPRAFFTNSPLHDTNFAVEGIRVCLAAARPIYALLGEPDQLQGIFPDAGHAFPSSSRQAAFAFLDGSLSSSHWQPRGWIHLTRAHARLDQAKSAIRLDSQRIPRRLARLRKWTSEQDSLDRGRTGGRSIEVRPQGRAHPPQLG